MDRRTFLVVYGGCVVSAMILAYVVGHGLPGSGAVTLSAMALPAMLGVYARCFNAPTGPTAPAFALAGVAFWTAIAGAPTTLGAAKGHGLMALYFVFLGVVVLDYHRR